MSRTRRSSSNSNQCIRPEEQTGTEGLEAKQRHSRSRRRLLQSIAAGGAAVTVRSIPDKWAKPALDTTILPVHAQATCQAESLSCTVTAIQFAAEGDANGSVFPAAPPITGPAGNATIDNLLSASGTRSCPLLPATIEQVDSATLSLAARVTPPCGPVQLVADLSGSDDYLMSPNPNTVIGVVDPDTGAVAFNNIMVDIDLTLVPQATGPSVESTSTLDLTFTAPGVNPCVIDIEFTEFVDVSCEGR